MRNKMFDNLSNTHAYYIGTCKYKLGEHWQATAPKVSYYNGTFYLLGELFLKDSSDDLKYFSLFCDKSFLIVALKLNAL